MQRDDRAERDRHERRRQQRDARDEPGLADELTELEGALERAADDVQAQRVEPTGLPHRLGARETLPHAHLPGAPIWYLARSSASKLDRMPRRAAGGSVWMIRT